MSLGGSKSQGEGGEGKKRRQLIGVGATGRIESEGVRGEDGLPC